MGTIFTNDASEMGHGMGGILFGLPHLHFLLQLRHIGVHCAILKHLFVISCKYSRIDAD